MNSKKVLLSLAVVLVLIASLAGGYLFYRIHRTSEKQSLSPAQMPASASEDYVGFRIFYPVNNKLQIAERRLPARPRQTAIAEAVLEEFFRGPGNGTVTPIPQNVKVRGVYRDAAQILYVDLSDEFRRNFQGDALAEYLVLKGIYESLMTNLQEIRDVKLVVEGKETESMGGHFYLKFPLKSTFAAEIKEEEKVSRE